MQWFKGRLLEDNRAVIDDRPLDNAALRFGASVFTTMRVYEQRLDHPRSQFSAHCDRLTRSLRTFDWPLPDWAAIYKGCQRLSADYPVIRITLFPDGTEWITGRSLPPELATWQQDGTACWLAPPTYARSLPTHKTGNYLACWLARQQAQKHGATEAILTNYQGDWLETATGNLWGWADGQWWTPLTSASEPVLEPVSETVSAPVSKLISESSPQAPASAFGLPGENPCLPGLMRSQIQRILSKKGHTVNGKAWRQALVSSFDAIAYTNCVVELVPIHTILDGHTTLEYNAHHASLKALRQWLTSSSTG